MLKIEKKMWIEMQKYSSPKEVKFTMSRQALKNNQVSKEPGKYNL